MVVLVRAAAGFCTIGGDRKNDFIVIDEIDTMEILSTVYRQAVLDVLDCPDRV
jgi:nucleoside-triphosphatase THEP1